MTDPKGEKPGSDHPHEDDLSLELHQDQEGFPPAAEQNPLEEPSVNASTEEFHFSGPVEELDFTEPSDFAFPTEQPTQAGLASEHSGEFSTPAEPMEFLGAEASPPAQPPPPEEAAVAAEPAGEGIADLESAEEAAEGEEKPKFKLPAWVRIAEWIMVGLLAAGALAAIFIAIVWVKYPGRITLTLNIACPVMLGLIPYALWRSMARWVTPAASAVYTVMLALSTAALIGGTWFEGMELSRYDWQFSKARVTAGKPPRGVITSPAEAARKPAEAAAK